MQHDTTPVEIWQDLAKLHISLPSNLVTSLLGIYLEVIMAKHYVARTKLLFQIISII